MDPITVVPELAGEAGDARAELIPSISIDALIARRDAVASRIHHMLTDYREVQELLEPIPYASHATTLSMNGTHRSFCTVEDAALMVRAVDARIWDHLLKQSGLWQLMDAGARRDWQNKIGKSEVPELTRANIEATFAELHQGRSAMFERGVVAVFRRLSWHYKTNSPVAFGRRLVMRGLVSTWKTNGRLHANGPAHEGCNQLDDLLRVLMTFEGLPEPATGSFQRLASLRWPREVDTVDLHDLLRVRGFNNGNGHVTFLRPDLIDRMNAIVAKHYPNVLPAHRD